MPDRLAAVMRLLRPVVLASLVVVLVAACSGGSGAPDSASASASAPSSAPSASAEPLGSTTRSNPSASGNDASGGAVGGNPGTGVTPIPIAPSSPGQPAGPARSPSPTEVQPVTGLLDVHELRATALEASMSNGHLIARVFWWSGPTPCSELAEVTVHTAGNTFSLTVREGAQQLGVACPALAVYKVTTVDLGTVSPGSYTVNALGVDHGIVVLSPG